MEKQKWGGWSVFWKAFRDASPVIFFFLFLFSVVYILFGMQYGMIVSVVTIFFQTCYKNNNHTFFSYLKLILVGSILIVLAYASSLNFLSCVFLNITVPFVLVFTQSSQYRPKGYFSYAMMFVFVSLIPPDSFQELGMFILVYWFCILFMMISLHTFFHLFFPRSVQKGSLSDLLYEMSNLMFLLVRPEKKTELEHRFQNLLHRFHQVSFQKNFFSVKTKNKQIHDMVNTLLQRFSYLLTDDEWREELDPEHVLLFGRMATFLREIASETDRESRRHQIKTAQMHLDQMIVPEGRVRIFCRSMLHILILILKTEGEETPDIRKIHRVSWRGLFQQVRTRFSPESFETRSALRLSAVMSISCVVSYLLPVTHSYWIPLNAFLLIQPSCEESSYRMMTRPVGTFIGCVIQFIVYPLLPGMAPQLVFALTMISLMYCAVPGTWYHPIFSTCYALTLAGMTMQETVAITLRLLFLAVAIGIVFLVNRFFFPIRKEALFRYNVRGLLRLNRSYWQVIRKELDQDMHLSVSSDILTYFHMIYGECTAYLEKNPNLPFSMGVRMLLLTLWHMFSELEQVHYLVRAGMIHPEEEMSFRHMTQEIEQNIYPVIHYKALSALKQKIHCREADVRYALNKYLYHVSLLGWYSRSIAWEHKKQK